MSETIEVVSIKFRNRGKMYFFDPAGMTLQEGDKVVVETSKGLELGTVVKGNQSVPADRVVQPLRPVVRPATEADVQNEEQNKKREREAYIIAKRKIEEHGLDMKLVDVEYSFEGNKILFFFSSDGRVDFRELVRDLASVFHTRIELRQIGVRDEARMLGGLGICGRPFCCSEFMDDFAPVSTKMAKTQSMSLNPAKISGCCGRLMCCLRHEQPAYEELVKNVPKNGAFVETPDGYGNVTQVNVLRQTVKVKLDGPGDDAFRSYDAEDVAAIPGGRPRDGSQPPHVLVVKPKKPKEPEPEELTGWEMPERLIVTEEERALAAKEKPENPRRNNRNRNHRDNTPAPGSGGKQNRSGKSRRSRSGSPKAGPSGEKREGDNKPAAHRSPKPQNNAAKPVAPDGGAGKTEPQQKKRHYNRNRRRPKSNGENGPKQGGEAQ
ncbi:MAG: stage 0 sporulation family protein [Oscillospiraceae bacterium]